MRKNFSFVLVSVDGYYEGVGLVDELRIMVSPRASRPSGTAKLIAPRRRSLHNDDEPPEGGS